jgi:hypothetical protein
MKRSTVLASFFLLAGLLADCAQATPENPELI